MADLSIQKAFLDGMQEVFKTMFTDQIVLKYMDTEMTYKNVYEESTAKVYGDPITLVGKVSLNVNQASSNTMATEVKSALMGTQVSATFTIPTKEFLDNNIPTTMKHLEELKKGIIEFDSIKYLIDEVVPKSYVAGIYLFYDFNCTKEHTATAQKLV